MEGLWRFRDEWLLRGLSGEKGAAPELIQQFRSEKKKFLSHALIDSGAVPLEGVLKAAAAASKTAYASVSPEKVDRFALSLLPEKLCRKYDLVPLKLTEGGMTVAMVDPTDLNALSDAEALTGRRVLPCFGLPREVESCLEQLFSADTVVFDLLSKVDPPDEIMVMGEARPENAREASVSSPVIKLVDSVISTAYRKRASDIHLEHEEKFSHFRFRVDGELKTFMKLPRHIASGPVVSRIKIMSDLDVSNHFVPQDGRTKLRIGTAEVGLRVSTLPTSFGEKVVMRILDQRAAEVPFEKLGFAPEVAAGLDKCMAQPQGILLVTGPTGSGKTTTLYSVLNKIKNETNNIVTAEDPIEYKLPGINQVQVNERQGLSFAAVLRSVLRQDPDIIMVGEIRDKETADIAFQAAMTGHLVFSTLHTNDTVSTLSRLVDMGVERFKISPGLLAITAQRLVRRLCPKCRQPVTQGEAAPAVIKALAEQGFEKTYYRAVGCKDCEMSGYSGRTSIVEMLTLSPRVKELINAGATAEEITRGAIETGALRSMTADGLWHLATAQADLKEIEPYLKLEKAAAAPAPAAPVPAAAAPAAAAQAVHAKAEVAAGRPRVMIADDDQVMRMLLRKFIETAGYEAVEAVDGEEALTKIAQGPAPDLLVSDVNMPKMNGFDLVKGVRGTLGLVDLPVIMLTTENSDKSQELAFQLGADDYVIKPFKGPLVMARITAALRRSGRLA